MRVQAQVTMHDESICPVPKEYIEHDLSTLFAKEVIKSLDMGEAKGFLLDSKIYYYDAFLITQPDYMYIMEYLQAIKFLSTSKADEEFADKIIALLQK